MDPRSLVVGVGDLLRLPFAFVFGVVDHGWFPLAIHLIVPIVGLGGDRVGDVLWLVPVFWLLVILVIDLLTVIPVFRFLCFRILKKTKSRFSYTTLNTKSGLFTVLALVLP